MENVVPFVHMSHFVCLVAWSYLRSRAWRRWEQAVLNTPKSDASNRLKSSTGMLQAVVDYKYNRG